MLRSFLGPASLAKGFFIRILLFGWLTLVWPTPASERACSAAQRTYPQKYIFKYKKWQIHLWQKQICPIFGTKIIAQIHFNGKMPLTTFNQMNLSFLLVLEPQ